MEMCLTQGAPEAMQQRSQVKGSGTGPTRHPDLQNKTEVIKLINPIRL